MATKRDAVIIGGGIIGCSIAYYLAKKGNPPHRGGAPGRRGGDFQRL